MMTHNYRIAGSNLVWDVPAGVNDKNEPVTRQIVRPADQAHIEMVDEISFLRNHMDQMRIAHAGQLEDLKRTFDTIRNSGTHAGTVELKTE